MMMNVGCRPFRSLPVGNTAPWCREINSTLMSGGRRRRIIPCCVPQFLVSPSSMPVRGCIRLKSTSAYTLVQAPNTIPKNSNFDYVSTRWKLAAIFAAIASGVCFDKLGIDEGDVETSSVCNTDDDDDDDDDDDPRILRTRIPRIATRLTGMTNRRRETSFRIRLGESVVVDRNVVDELSSRTVAHDDTIVLVLPEDEDTISPFLYFLMQQTTLTRISEADRSLYRLPLGLPGIACTHCEHHDSWEKLKARCEIFPMDRRTLPAQVRRNLYYHIRKCEKCPPEVKLELKRLEKLEPTKKISREERLFFKKLWFRMGHKSKL